MKNKTLYDKTIAILVKAYMNDTLEHGNCRACAVGNLVAHYQNIKYDNCSSGKKWLGAKRHAYWDQVFCTMFNTTQFRHMDYYRGEAKKEIDSTGYNVDDLAKIEYAFETSNKGNSKEEFMYNGLMAVVEVLGEIHEVSQEVTEETKLMFVK